MKNAKNVIIVVLAVLVLVLGGFIVCDKFVLKSDAEVKTNENKKDVVEEATPEIEEKDSTYFNYYLRSFLNTCSGLSYNDIDDITDEVIYRFVSTYYSAETKTTMPSEDGSVKYSVPVSVVDEVVYQYFGTKSYNFDNVEGTFKNYFPINKENDVYVFSWRAVDCGANVSFDENPTVKYDGENVEVSFKIKELGKENGKERVFHLKYNDGYYNVIKVNTVEAN